MISFQLLRASENKLGKTQIKNEEAENITANYLTLISHFQVGPARTLYSL